MFDLLVTQLVLGLTISLCVCVCACVCVFLNCITVALMATGFLIGPKKQCVKMWDVTRRWSTGFYLLMLIVVLVVALLKQNIFLVLFLLFIQIMAAVWYSISYIPFGRKMTLKFLRAIYICFPCFFVYDATTEAYKEQTRGESSTTRFTNMINGSDKS